MSVNFGTGTLIATPNAGDLAANPTPMKFGTLQDVSIDFTGDIKELFGQYQFAVDTARGKIKIAWKAKAAQLIGKQVNDLFFSETVSTPMTSFSIDEGPTAIPTTPFQITVSHSATWVTDGGVYNSATGLPLTKVPSAPTTGQYSVAAGIYTFAAADTGNTVLISYDYIAAAGVGNGFIINNHAMGYGPIFQILFTSQYKGKQLNCQLNACRATKLALATKQDDYTIPEFDGTAFADASNTVGRMWFSD
jgi:hypothetical protein